MKRIPFVWTLLGLSGLAKAQQWRECVPDKRNVILCSEDRRPALNNQCPVCGTMAAVYAVPMLDGGIVRKAVRLIPVKAAK